MTSKSPARQAGTSHCVAIDLGAMFVRVVEVELSGGESRILRRGVAALPLHVWNDIAVHRDAMANAIREAMSAAGISARAVVACLPRHLVTVRFARLPHAPPAQLRGMIEFEAQQYILFPLDEVTLDYRVMTGAGVGLSSPGEDDMQTVLLAAARKSLVAEIMRVFDRAGLELTLLSVSALALAEHGRDSLEPTALINLDPGELDVAVVAEGQLLFTRASALDIQNIQPEVAGRKLGEEVARSFTAYQNEFRQKPLSHVYLSGANTGGSQNEWIERALTDVLEMPVSRLQTRLINPSDPEARAYAVAAGLALQVGSSSIAGVNLVPNERAEKKAQQRKRVQQQLMVVGIGALVIFGGLFFNNVLAAQRKLQKQTLTANNDLNEETAKYTVLKKAYDKQKGLETELVKGLDRNHPSVDVLVALNQAMPASAQIWLTQMSFERNGLLTLRGDAKVPQAATDLVLNMQRSGAFTEVKLSYLGDAQDTSGGGNGTTAAAPVKVTAPPVTPLPGLNPAGTPGAAPGTVVPGGPVTTPGAVPGNTNGVPAGFGNRTFGPGGFGGRTFGPGGFNPGGGANPGGFNPGGNPGNFNPGNPGNYNPGGVNPAGGAVPGGGAVPVPTPNGGATPAPTIPTPPVPQTIPQSGVPRDPQTSLRQDRGVVVITPTLQLAGQGGGNPPAVPSYDPAGAPQGGTGSAFPNMGGGGGWRRRGNRNGVTFPGGDSSFPVNPGGMNPGSGTMPPTGTMPQTPAPGAQPAPKPQTRVVPKPAVTKAPKQILTSFVITCRINSSKNALISAAAPSAAKPILSEPTTVRTVARQAVKKSEDNGSGGDLGEDNADQ